MKKHTCCGIVGIVGIVAVVLLSVCAPASAVGFMVNPMRMDATPQPDTRLELPLKLLNTQEDGPQLIDVRLWELTQSRDGVWQALDPASDPIPANISSCLDWVSVSADTVNVAPLQSAELTVKIDVPRGARGFYGAALTAQTRGDPDAKGIATVIRFLVPILLEVQGRSVRQQVELVDTGMIFREAQGDQRGTALLSMTVVNTGQTLSRIRGEANVFHFASNEWRRVCSSTFEERGVIPGVTVIRTSDLERRLPSGRYKIATSMSADGRRYRPLTKEIDFIGDPAVGDVPVDVAFVVDPSQLEIEGVPGARRSAYLTIENPTDVPLEVVCSVLQPQELQGVAMGDIRGDDFSCHEWTEIVPARFTFRAGTKRKLAVQVAYPNPSNKKPYYYGTFDVAATYPDGQLAGSAKGLIIVRNKLEEATSRMSGMGMSLARREGEQYSVLATFGNTGDIHLEPKPRGSVIAIDGTAMRSVAAFDFSQESGLVLPLGVRHFSGTADFFQMAPGAYIIQAVAEYKGGETEQTLAIRVSENKEEGKVVDVIKLGDRSEGQEAQ